MGYLNPGGKFVRFGDRLLNDATRDQVEKQFKEYTVRPRRTTGSTFGLQKTGTADISRTAPTFNDPRYTFTTLSIPTDQRTLNGLYRFFDDTDPVVGNAIRLHTEFPLSRMGLTDCGDSVIQRHFEEMWQRINIDKLLFDIGLEYWRLGNVHPFGSWNSDDYMWNQFVILNPDYVTVESVFLTDRPFIKLQPDEHLKKIVNSGQPRYLFEKLAPEIIKYVKLGQEIPLSPNNVFHLAHNKAPYENLGRSIIKRILKILIYEDRLSMANFAIATRQTIPITVVKLGDPQGAWLPQPSDVEDFQELLSAREIDPNFTIVYHWGVDIQFYGANGKIVNLSSEFARTLKWKLIGLGISEAILSGGSNYASAYAQLEVLRQRYLHFQMMLERFVHKGLFETVSRLCGFYRTRTLQAGRGGVGYKYGEANADMSKELSHSLSPVNSSVEYKSYLEHLRSKADSSLNGVSGAPWEDSVEFIYPKLNWDLMSLNNDMQYKNFLINLEKLFPDIRKISEATLFRAANLDPDIERRNIKKEHAAELQDAYDKAKLDKEYTDRFNKEGLPLPKVLAPQMPLPGGAAGGIGGGAIPGMPAPGDGGVGAGNRQIVPNQPIGKPNLSGAGSPPAPPASPGTPAAARQESVNIQREMTAPVASVHDDYMQKLVKESQVIQHENVQEAKDLAALNRSFVEQHENRIKK